MREYWNLQEQLMVDAWKDGGEVDGKPVTDDRLLQFWQDRRDSMSPDDPLWDHYNNLYQQYDFAIRESKVGLDYAQKKMTAREVAQWYKSEATKYVPDSEIYRTIMGQAAKFLDAARAQTRASNAERRAKAYVAVRDQTYKDELFPSMYVTQGLTWAFRNFGLLNGSQNFTGTQGDESQIPVLGDGDQLTGLSYQAGSAQMWETVLGIINDPASPMHQAFYDQFIAPAERQGLALDLPLNQQDLEALLQRSMTGYDHLIAVDKRFDDVAPPTNANKLRDQQLSTLDTFQFLFVLDEVAIYAQRRQTFENAISDPNASLFDLAKALTDYHKGLNSLAISTADQNPVMSTALRTEMRYLSGDTAGLSPTIAEDALLTPFGYNPTASQDAAAWSGLSQNVFGVIDDLVNGRAVAVQRDPATGVWTSFSQADLLAMGKNYMLVPHSGAAPTLTAGATPTDRLTGQATLGTSPTFTYGELYVAEPITVTASSALTPDEATGRYIGPDLPAASPGVPARDQNIGLVVTIPSASGPGTKVYGIYTNGGQVRWTTESPFVAGSTLSQTQTDTGLVVQANPNAPGVGFTTPQGEPYFNPQGVVDATLFAPNSTHTFVDPSIALLAGTQAGRQQIAGMDAQQLITTLQSSPWVNWNDQAQVTELWQDIGAIKNAASRTPGSTLAGYQAEYDFYSQLASARGIDNSLFAPRGLLDPNAFALQTFVRTGLRLPGVENMDGFDLALRQRDQMAQEIYRRTASAQAQMALASQNPAAYAQQAGLPQYPKVWSPPTTTPGQQPAQAPAGPPPILPYSQYGQPQPTTPQISVPGLPSMTTPSPSIATPTPPSPTPPPIAPPPPTPPPYIPPPPPIYPGGACFVAGTLISTARGSVPIEDVEVGDEVLAYDSRADSFVLADVDKTFVHRADLRQRIRVTLDDGTTVEATAEHPFFSPDTQQYDRLDLFSVGDSVLGVSGKKTITAMEEQPAGETDLYNLSVHKLHTYIANGVVVHNKVAPDVGY